MDGNGRWSKKKNKSLKFAYNEGAKKLLNLSQYLYDTHNINYISAFALSSHNLTRHRTILKTILETLNQYLDEFIERYPKVGIKILRGISTIISTRLRRINDEYFSIK